MAAAASTRRRQGAVLLGGAAVFYALLGIADVGFHWTPLVLGVVYLSAAAVGGPDGSYWSTAVVLSVFGLGPVARFAWNVDASAASLYVIALGLAVLIAAQLAERQVAITTTAVGVTMLALGVVFALQTHLGIIEEPGLYTGLLVLVGAARVARPAP